ncbi:ABC transporter ATP-binding protein [Sulfitobacter sp. F26204]|uniref:ABC transporter ATP-binding protein n=1 Tax=Sulfitobacter sp. F26204 TaxID=2996014 RepID=UPI00225DF8E5|nr:ABC transporter ATP-binding protein [Sulfitobacter sp. F26204]
MSNLLSVKGLGLSFSEKGPDFLRDVNFDLNKGETLCIVGESGCGKSLTALSLMGLLAPSLSRRVKGELSFEGQSLRFQDQKKLQQMRGGRLSMIFQEPMTSLNPSFRIGDQISEAWQCHHGAGGRERALEMLERVGIPDAKSRMNDYPHQLSGGMRQRVMIAMALVNNPSLVIADEPTTALDVTVQSQILKLMNDMQKTLNMGIILITHDLGVVAQVATRVAVMYAGEVVEHASAEAIFNDPQHPYTIGLIASVPPISGPRERLTVIPGRVPLPGSLGKGCRFAGRCPFATEICQTDPPVQLMEGSHFVRCHHAPIENMKESAA